MGYLTVDQLLNSNVIADIKNCADTNRLQYLIDYCTAIINGYCNTDFNNYPNETILADGEGIQLLNLGKRIYRLESVTDVVTKEIYPNVIIYSDKRFLFNRESTFSDDCANIEVVGDFGWETVPQDVINVLVALCNMYYGLLNDASALGKSVGPLKSESIGDYSYQLRSYNDTIYAEGVDTTGDPRLDLILDKYKVSDIDIGVI